MNLIDKITSPISAMIHDIITWLFSDQTFILTGILALGSIFLLWAVLVKLVSTIKFIMMKRAMLNGLLRVVGNGI